MFHSLNALAVILSEARGKDSRSAKSLVEERFLALLRAHGLKSITSLTLTSVSVGTGVVTVSGKVGFLDVSY